MAHSALSPDSAERHSAGWRSGMEGEYMYTEHRYFESRDELLEFLKSFDSVPDEQKPKVYLVDDDTGEMTRVM